MARTVVRTVVVVVPLGVKVAVTVLSQSAMREVGLAVPANAPLQLEKMYPGSGTASRVMIDPIVIVP